MASSRKPGAASLAALAIAALLGTPIKAGHAADQDALWKIVHDCCEPDQREHGDPKPCALVDDSGGAGRGYAVLKDLNGVAQFLLIPTERLTGIEDPALLAPGAPNYFADAWNARTFVEGQMQRALPRDAHALVINSVQGRTQEQLHIHVDCIRADVRDALRLHGGEVGATWAPFPVLHRGGRGQHDPSPARQRALGRGRRLRTRWR